LVRQQPDLYADLLMLELEKRGIPYRNEQQLQDLSVEPVARLIVDYLLSLYGAREPKAWLRLMDQLIPFADEADQADMRQDWQRFIKSERKQAELIDLSGGNRWLSGWSFVESFLNRLGSSCLAALSPDYESVTRLGELVQETKARIEEQLKIEPDLIKALAKFSDDQAVRILTIHKSKGLEFDSVIILGVENQTFWSKEADERCAFFVGMSRAKRRLVLTTCQTRCTPSSNPSRWSEQRTQHREFIGYALPFLNRES
jgi:superfamily I DNA/RNA helicase